MPKRSAIAAAMELYESLTAANFPGATRPPIFLDEAPVVDSNRVRPPYVVIRDGGATDEPLFDGADLENGSFTLDIYAHSLDDADTIRDAVKWNGLAPSARAGFDRGTLPLTSPRGHVKLVPGSHSRRLAGLDYESRRVHLVSAEYRYAIRVTLT